MQNEINPFSELTFKIDEINFKVSYNAAYLNMNEIDVLLNQRQQYIEALLALAKDSHQHIIHEYLFNLNVLDKHMISQLMKGRNEVKEAILKLSKIKMYVTN